MKQERNNKKVKVEEEKQELNSLASKINKTPTEQIRLGKLLKKYYGIEPIKFQGIKEY